MGDKPTELLVKTFIKQINKMVDNKIQKIVMVQSAIVESVNQDGTVNIKIPPDNTIFTGVSNQSIYQDLQNGDCVKIIKPNGSSSNMWIIGAHQNIKHSLHHDDFNAVGKIASFVVGGATNWETNSLIQWDREQFNNSNDLIHNLGNGKIRINHTGYIKISVNLWIGKNNAQRMWCSLYNCNTGNNITDMIVDPLGGFDTVSLSNYIIPVTKGQCFGVYLIDTKGSNSSSATAVTLNGGTSRQSSYITIEIIK